MAIDCWLKREIEIIQGYCKAQCSEMQYYWAGWESLLLPFRLDTAVFHRWIWLFSFAENTIYSNHFIKTITAWLSFGINVPEWNSNSTKNFSGDYTITTLGQAAQDRVQVWAAAGHLESDWHLLLNLKAASKVLSAKSMDELLGHQGLCSSTALAGQRVPSDSNA